MEAKKNAQNYLEKLLNTKDDERINMHERHIKEIDNLREKHQKEIQLAKDSLADLYEKKVQHLTETKDEYEL